MPMIENPVFTPVTLHRDFRRYGFALERALIREDHGDARRTRRRGWYVPRRYYEWRLLRNGSLCDFRPTSKAAAEDWISMLLHKEIGPDYGRGTNLGVKP